MPRRQLTCDGGDCGLPVMRHVQRGHERSGAGLKHSRGEVVAIVSGKGGVGKTNLALNLSIQLSRCRQRVILVDADFGLANADILADLSPLGTFSDLLDPDRDVDELLVEGPAGLRVLCGVSGCTAGGGWDFDPQDCVWALERLRTCCDVLLVDCGNAVNPTLVALAVSSDLLLLTTTPEPTALADCYATLKYLSNRGFSGRTGLVVNMARTQAEAVRVGRRLGRVAAQFLGLSVEIMGHVLMDRHVPLAVRARVPVVVRYPRCAATACMDDICARLLPSRAGSDAGVGLWSRLASLFL